MLLEILLLLATVIAVVGAVLFSNHEKAKAAVAHIPGITTFIPFYVPIPGRVLSRNNMHRHVANHLIPKFGPIFKLAAYKYPLVIIADADVLKDVFVKKAKSYEKSRNFYAAFDYFGPNILTSNGEEWRKHRVLCNPAFSDAHLKHVVSVTTNTVTRMLKHWEETQNTSKFTINSLDQMMRITLQVIGEAGFGYDLRAIEADNMNFDPSKHSMNFRDALVLLNEGVPFRLRLPQYTWGLGFGKMGQINKAAKAFEKYMEEIIAKRREEAKDPNNDFDRHDLLSLLLSSTSDEYQGQKLNDSELRADTFTFLLAGHETTATLMMWSLYLLAKFPEKQKKLHAELDRVLIDGRIPTHDDIDNNLPYNSFVIKEVLRHQPPVVLVSKILDQDETVGEYLVKKDTMISIPIFALHHSEKYWDNPNEFLPERWDESLPTYRKPHQFAYIPFSMGARNCIGQKFALVESRIILAMLLKNYTVELSPELVEHPEERLIITLQCQKPLNIILKKR